MIAASYEPVSILWDVLGALESIVRMQDPHVNRAHSRAQYYDRTHSRRRHRRSSSITTKNKSTVKTAVVLDVLRNAGLVSSIIALFALLPEDAALVKKMERDEKEKEKESDEEENEDDEELIDEDEAMLRDQLCKSAHLGGTVLQMLCRLDDECVTNTENILEESLDELMEIPTEHLLPLERRFTKYLHRVVLPARLKKRFHSLTQNSDGNGDGNGDE